MRQQISRRRFLSGLAPAVACLGAPPDLMSSPRRASAGIRLTVTKFQLGSFVRYSESHGDTWISAWADDGELYVVSDDTHGFNHPGPGRNLMVHRLSGHDPAHLVPLTVNTMDEYGTDTAPMSALQYGEAAAEDGRAWKANGITCIDGSLYVFVSKHDYPSRNKSLQDHRQTAADASIIRSTDHGRTWTRSARENYNAPMFPGRSFGAPFFITYGQDGRSSVDRSAEFVYAVSNNGFWNNGDRLYLGRVRREHLPRLQSSDWEFYSGGDGRRDKAWANAVDQAVPVLVDPGHIGMSAVQYIEPLRLYLLCQWHYPPDTFGGPTIWCFRTAVSPWGPWQPLAEQTFVDGYYNPAVMQKFTRADDRQMYLSTAGDFQRPQTLYKFTTVSVALEP